MLIRLLACGGMGVARLLEVGWSRRNLRSRGAATEGAWTRRTFPLIVAVQLFLAFISYDVESVPRRALHRTLKPLRTSIDVDGTNVPLGPGMEVTTEIRTGTRRIIDYVFSPLQQMRSEALRER